MSNTNTSNDNDTPRIATVRGASDLDTIRRYLPTNYALIIVDNYTTPKDLRIVGVDVAGWTLDGYVIPRLLSGAIYAHEITPDTPDN